MSVNKMTAVPLSLYIVVSGGWEAVILHHSGIEGETHPLLQRSSAHANAGTAFSNSNFIHGAKCVDCNSSGGDDDDMATLITRGYVYNGNCNCNSAELN